MKVTDKYVDPIESAKAKAIADYEVKTKQDVPGEIIDLPSQGKFYPKNHPLRTGKIEMKYMTAREEDILTNPSYLRQGVVIEKLLDSMITTSGVTYNNILKCDTDTLIVGARILGYGKKYLAQVVTEKNKPEKIEIDLTQLELNYVDVKTDDNGYFEHTTSSGTQFKLKLISNLDVKNFDAEQLITSFLKASIVEINGETSTDKISTYIDTQLRIVDSRELQKYIQSCIPSIDLSIEISDEQGGITKSGFQLDSSFFWPEL
jgi:hypothetical protein|tara:strand:+ start:290 stop:1072 length:783 start_codon:yes stop_codon:yes gene_type:complete